MNLKSNTAVSSELISDSNSTQNVENKKNSPVIEKKLGNGLTVLVRSQKNVPLVSVQLWYNVGSRDEKDKERGIAHLIEHMIFKGTDKLSESDINVLTHKLSGYTNAFTSYDYTGYLFNFPRQHWIFGFDILADCMKHVHFNGQMLNSEMKAVIQELKMYKDRYVRSLFDEMLAVIFSEHPYHHPIIGYKHDLWTVASDDLKAFYKKHYHPNNATLVVVGDVTPQEVFDAAEKYFGSIPPVNDYKREELHQTPDLSVKQVTMYRDVKQPTIMFAFVVPGTAAKKDHLGYILSWILGYGKGSRLYNRLVNKLQLVTSVKTSYEDLFEYSVFFITVEPKDLANLNLIETEILSEIRDIVENGVTDHELTRAVRQTQMEIYGLMEDFERQAYEIGKYALATGDPNYIFNFIPSDMDLIKHQLQEYARKYMRKSLMHTGKILPIIPEDLSLWSDLQKESDELDSKILSVRERTLPVEPERYAKEIIPLPPVPFAYPKSTDFTLSNGLEVLSYKNTNTPKIDITISLKAKDYYDSDEKPGLYNFMTKMLMEGTKNYNNEALVDALESRGIQLRFDPGYITMSLINKDLSYGLGLLYEILTHAAFPQESIEKVRSQLNVALKNAWDTPSSISMFLSREKLYAGHPYAKNILGNFESIMRINRDDLVSAYKQFISPHGARMAIVGDFDPSTLEQVLNEKLGTWKGEKISDITFPALSTQHSSEVVTHPINRDQVFLHYATRTIKRLDPDFDKLLLFDQIFGGGSLGSMASKLFELREQTGLFYTIRGSLVSGANEQPGVFEVYTIVSGDRLAEAEKSITHLIETVIDSITQEDLEQAKNAIINTLISNFESDHSIGRTFLYLKRYGLSKDYYDKRAGIISKITLDEVKNAARKFLSQPRITIKVGREEVIKPHTA